MKPLTIRQIEVLDFVRGFYADHGFPPTMREVAAGVGLRSISTVSGHMQVLAGRGYLVRFDSGARCYYPHSKED